MYEYIKWVGTKLPKPYADRQIMEFMPNVFSPMCGWVTFADGEIIYISIFNDQVHVRESKVAVLNRLKISVDGLQWGDRSLEDKEKATDEFMEALNAHIADVVSEIIGQSFKEVKKPPTSNDRPEPAPPQRLDY